MPTNAQTIKNPEIINSGEYSPHFNDFINFNEKCEDFLQDNRLKNDPNYVQESHAFIEFRAQKVRDAMFQPGGWEQMQNYVKENYGVGKRDTEEEENTMMAKEEINQKIFELMGVPDRDSVINKTEYGDFRRSVLSISKLLPRNGNTLLENFQDPNAINELKEVSQILEKIIGNSELRATKEENYIQRQAVLWKCLLDAKTGDKNAQYYASVRMKDFLIQFPDMYAHPFFRSISRELGIDSMANAGEAGVTQDQEDFQMARMYSYLKDNYGKDYFQPIPNLSQDNEAVYKLLWLYTRENTATLDANEIVHFVGKDYCNDPYLRSVVKTFTDYGYIARSMRETDILGQMESKFRLKTILDEFKRSTLNQETNSEDNSDIDFEEIPVVEGEIVREYDINAEADKVLKEHQQNLDRQEIRKNILNEVSEDYQKYNEDNKTGFFDYGSKAIRFELSNIFKNMEKEFSMKGRLDSLLKEFYDYITTDRRRRDIAIIFNWYYYRIYRTMMGQKENIIPQQFKDKDFEGQFLEFFLQNKNYIPILDEKIINV